MSKRNHLVPYCLTLIHCHQTEREGKDVTITAFSKIVALALKVSAFMLSSTFSMPMHWFQAVVEKFIENKMLEFLLYFPLMVCKMFPPFTCSSYELMTPIKAPILVVLFHWTSWCFILLVIFCVRLYFAVNNHSFFPLDVQAADILAKEGISAAVRNHNAWEFSEDLFRVLLWPYFLCRL